MQNNNQWGFNPQQQPQFNFIPKIYDFVNGIEGAKAYQVRPSQTVILIDSDSPLMYLKQANYMGQSNITFYKIDSIDENEAKKLSMAREQATMGNYATKEQFEALEGKINDLLKKLEDKQNA